VEHTVITSYFTGNLHTAIISHHVLTLNSHPYTVSTDT